MTNPQSYAGGGHRPENDEIGEVGQAQLNTHETDDLLDEIDGLLENNAEEFVKAYVQKGGE